MPTKLPKVLSSRLHKSKYTRLLYTLKRCAVLILSSAYSDDGPRRWRALMVARTSAACPQNQIRQEAGCLGVKADLHNFNLNLSSRGPENRRPRYFETKSQIPMDNDNSPTPRGDHYHRIIEENVSNGSVPPQKRSMAEQVDPRNVQGTRGSGSLGAEQLGSRPTGSGQLHRSRYKRMAKESSATSTALKLSRTSLRTALFGTGLQIREDTLPIDGITRGISPDSFGNAQIDEHCVGGFVLLVKIQR